LYAVRVVLAAQEMAPQRTRIKFDEVPDAELREIRNRRGRRGKKPTQTRGRTAQRSRIAPGPASRHRTDLGARLSELRATRVPLSLELPHGRSIVRAADRKDRSFCHK